MGKSLLASVLVIVPVGTAAAGVTPPPTSTGSISGTVRDNRGEPVAGACVQAATSNGMGGTGFATTGTNGTYLITLLSTGRYGLNFRDCNGGGLASEWYHGKISFQDADLVPVTQGHTTKDINVTLVPGGSITGTVNRVNQSGGQPGVCVNATDAAGNPAGDQPATTGPTGMYQISNLYPGSYKVHFQDCGVSGLADQWFNNQVTTAAANPVHVVSGQVTGNINATLGPEGSIAGTVTFADAQSAARVCVTAFGSGTLGPSHSETQTSVSGTYRLSLPRGSYKIEFGYCDSPTAVGLSAAPQWYPDEADQSAATPVTVSDGVTTSHVDTTLEPKGPFYLSLGDSVGMWNGVNSYPFLVTQHERSTVPGLRVVDLSCSGETTSSMIASSLCAPGGSQYLNALAFLAAHRNNVSLVTIGIGGNDVVGCISAPDPAGCFLKGLATMEWNLAYILAGLRAAAGPAVPIVGMNIYNPLLGDWLAPGPSRQLALLAEAGVKILSATMDKTFAAAGSPVANVKHAFQTGDLTHFVSSPWGLVPVAVDRACTLLDIVCHIGQPEGFGDDPNIAGAQVIAKAFETTIGALRPPAVIAGAR